MKVFAQAAASRLSDVQTWSRAANLALATGNRETYRELCRTGVLRFASTAQGQTALTIAKGLLVSPTDETTLSLARGVVERRTFDAVLKTIGDFDADSKLAS